MLLQKYWRTRSVGKITLTDFSCERTTCKPLLRGESLSTPVPMFMSISNDLIVIHMIPFRYLPPCSFICSNRCSFKNILWCYDYLGLDSSKLRDRLGFPWHSDPDTEILSLDDSIATFLIGIGSEVESCLSTILTLPSSVLASSSWKLGSWPGRGETPPLGPLHRFLVPSLPRWSALPNSCCTCNNKFLCVTSFFVAYFLISLIEEDENCHLFL